MSPYEHAMNMLGLIQRAGRVVSGDALCEQALRSDRADIVLIDSEASAGTYEKYRRLCGNHGAFLIRIEPGRLGQAIGRPERMVAVLRKGPMEEKLMTLLETATIKNRDKRGC